MSDRRMPLVEWEPEYWDKFYAYIKVKGALGYAILTTILGDKMNNELRKTVINRLTTLLEEMHKDHYIQEVLSNLNEKNLTETISSIIRFLEGKLTIEYAEYKEYKNLLTKTFDNLVEKYKDLEVKALGKLSVIPTHHL